MCGIYITNLPIKEEKLKTKLDWISHRGPDFTGVFQENNLSFGHTRLSILDLDPRSNQPMHHDHFIMVFNGEIYNYKTIKRELEELGETFLTQGDSEVLMIGYKRWGKALVPKLNGMFAFAIYDQKKQSLFCSRDRLGVKPFYYYWNDGEFEICSQIQPLSENKKVNQEAVSIYLQTGYVPSPFSIYENVHKLPPGSNLEIDLKKKTKSIQKYWDLSPVKKTSLTYEEAKEKLHKLLIDAVKIRLQSDVPYGSFLSGGIDSALVSAIASKLTQKKLKTFTVGFEDKRFDESLLAKEFSKTIETNHIETICSPQDLMDQLPKLFDVYGEPFADSSAIPSLLLNKTTKPHVTVVLSGDGGDESFLGYNHFDWSKKVDLVFKIPYFIRNMISFLLPFSLFGKRADGVKEIIRFKSFHNFIESIFIGFSSMINKRDKGWLSHYDSFKYLSNDTLQKIADLNIKLWLENDSNVKVDRASMAYSVEVRSPFLDYRIVEFARTLPVCFRYNNGRRKIILKDILEEYIPKEIFEVPKKGFSIPIGDWIRNELKDEFLKNLSDKHLNKIKNLNIKKFKKLLEDHLSNKEDYSTYVWRVYVLSKWYQKNESNR